MTTTEQEVLDLTDAVKSFGRTVVDLKNRRMHLTIAIGVVVFVVACIVAWIVFFQNPTIKRTADRAASAETQLKISDRARCESVNDFRKADRARWQFILDLTPPPMDAAAKDRTEQFIKFINEADKLQPC